MNNTATYKQFPTIKRTEKRPGDIEIVYCRKTKDWIPVRVERNH